jgi:PBSX family phage portal protein
MAEQLSVTTEKPIPPKKAEAYILGDGEIITRDHLEKFRVKKQEGEGDNKKKDTDSGQVEEESWANLLKKNAIVTPPYDFRRLILLLDNDSTHYRCVKQKATDIAGRGWDIVPAISPEKANLDNKEKLVKFFSFCNPNESFLEVMKKCWVDYESMGNLGLEVVRKDNVPKALYHIPFHTMRVCTDNNTYIQIRGSKKIRFRRFNTEEKIYKAWIETIGDVKDIPDSGHEIIHILNYHPCSSYYGVPDIISALGGMLGQMEARDYNLRFFENNAVPDYAIVIEGGEFTPESKKVIKAYFENELKGSAHRTLVLPVEEGVKVTFEKLTAEVRDASFRLYRADNRDEIVRAHGIPPRRVGIATAGMLGGTGEAKWQAENYKTSVVRPSQEVLEYRINDFLIKTGFGISDWRLKFSQIDITDELTDAKVNEIYVKAGVKSVNQVRGELGLEPVTGGEEPWVQTARGAVPLSQLHTILESNRKELEKDDREWYEDALERLREELHGFNESV